LFAIPKKPSKIDHWLFEEIVLRQQSELLIGLLKHSFFNGTYLIFCDKGTIFLESFVKKAKYLHIKN